MGVPNVLIVAAAMWVEDPAVHAGKLLSVGQAALQFNSGCNTSLQGGKILHLWLAATDGLQLPDKDWIQQGLRNLTTEKKGSSS